MYCCAINATRLHIPGQLIANTQEMSHFAPLHFAPFDMTDFYLAEQELRSAEVEKLRSDKVAGRFKMSRYGLIVFIQSP